MTILRRSSNPLQSPGEYAGSVIAGGIAYGVFNSTTSKSMEGSYERRQLHYMVMLDRARDAGVLVSPWTCHNVQYRR